MTITRTPLVSSTDPDTFSQGVITSGAGTKNILYTKYPGDKVYASQRPSIEAFTTPSQAAASNEKGRGLVFWGETNTYYFVRDDQLYFSSYTTAIGTISAGDSKVYFVEVGNQLVVIDPSSSRAWYLDSSASTTLIEIVDANFPGSAGIGKTIVGGGVSLDGFLFIMTSDGFIYNSNLNSVQSWNALDFISTDVLPDGGVYLAKHHNHICAIGENSTEFFFNAGNPVGSPLQRRQDISFLIGALDDSAVSESGDDIFFIGREYSGTLGLYRLSNFKPLKVSPTSIDKYIGNVYRVRDPSNFVMRFTLSACWFGDNLLCFLTAASIDASPEAIKTRQTIVYDATTQLWSEFESGLSIIDKFEVISSARSSKGTSIFPNGETAIMFRTGSVCRVRNDGDIIDTDLVSAGSAGIVINITTVEYDYDTMTNKFIDRLSVVGTTVSGATNDIPLKVSWTDDRYRTFTSTRDLDTGFRRSLTRLGNFKRRAWVLNYTGTDLLKLEALEFNIRASQYA